MYISKDNESTPFVFLTGKRVSKLMLLPEPYNNYVFESYSELADYDIFDDSHTVERVFDDGAYEICIDLAKEWNLILAYQVSVNGFAAIFCRKRTL